MHGVCMLCNDYLVRKWGYGCVSGVGMRMVSMVCGSMWCCMGIGCIGFIVICLMPNCVVLDGFGLVSCGLAWLESGFGCVVSC